MKNDKNTRPHLGIPKAEFMKNSSFNFIENERMCNVVQSGHKMDENRIKKHGEHYDASLIEKSTLVNRTEAMPQETITTTEVRTEAGRYTPKKYVTKCYFQPKQNPVSYSETVILTLGSNKKHYFDTVLYQTKLIPFRWTESMTTSTLPQTFYEFKSNYECFVEETKCDYVSLEPQQLAAQGLSNSVQEIKV